MSYSGHNKKDDELLVTWMERFVPTPVILDYILRKLLLGLVMVNLFVLRQVSKVYGFNFDCSVGDRDSWKWDVRKRLPLYKASVEKID